MNNKEEPSKPENPYPKSIFREPTDEQYQIIYDALKREGLTLDRFSGAYGRKVWIKCDDDWQKYHTHILSKIADEERVLKTIMGVSAFHNHQDYPMPKRYWKLLVQAISKMIRGEK